ncbi:ABC transporter ATP-binding protein [Plantactinospora sp. S1510]|uniref:ABC transporter ATP-binding protein n=1 Tax=Plantactinospora alkalitolerans TaxID=2789879 RepID=A0ABS0GVM3_9ACTN|nr:ABC transporter ATP-binding protein [Plantactinospora alkalitolerans]MBF9130240.1 ABC transporter ATP-binding protein [Plantactinospora alkalitolerans]
MTSGGTRPKVDFRLVTAAVRLAYRAAPGAAVAQALIAIGGGLLPVLVGVLTKMVVDRLAGLDGGPVTTVIGLAVGLGVAGVAVATLPHLFGYVDAEWRRAVAVRAQADLYAAVDRLPGLVRLEDPAFRDHLNVADSAGRHSPVTIAGSSLELLRSIVTIAGFAGTLALLNPWMVGVLALAALPTAQAELRLARQRAGLFWRLSPIERRQYFYANLLTGLAAAKEIRLFDLGGLFGQRMIKELRTLNAENRRMDRREVLVQAGLAVVGAVVAGAGLIWAIVAARGGRLSIGDVTIFVAALAGIQGAVASGIGQVATAHEGLLRFTHYREVLGTAPDLPLPAEPVPVPPLRGGIELRDVWFRYGDGHPWVLRGVDLTIPPGRTVALVGLNGAGKSTLVKLLARFYDPTRGSLSWDGVDYRELDVVQLRNRIGAAFQDYMSYDLSAEENIGLGDTTAFGDTGRIVTAAERAGVHDVLTALPHGYATQLSRTFADPDDRDDESSGVLLSGGQWQRLALARSFLRAGRDLLILDEPSAGLDAEAEADLHQRLRGLREGRTTLLISHRLGTVRDADHIVVLRDGVIAEQGSHDELLTNQGAYARLFNLQAAGYQPVPG